MNEIPQTFTLVDSQLEHKKIRDEIAVLKQERETALRERNEAIEARDDVHKTHERIVKELRAEKEHLGNHAEDLLEEIEVFEKKKENLEAEIASRRQEREILDREIETKVSEINTHREEVNKILLQKEIATRDLHDLHEKNVEEEDSASKRLAELYEEQKRLELRNTSYEDEYSKKKEEQRVEGIRLVNKESDLNIYENRLRTKCAELYPDMKIIL
jgi:chromosome segregation ATPase